MRLSIIIPAYNESKRISSTIKRYIQFFEEKYGEGFEIVVISDGSDDTGFIVNKFREKYPQIKLFEFHKRLGKGCAVAKGFEKSEGDVVAYTDADGSLAPENLYSLIKILQQCNYDGVIASRFLDNRVQYPLMRRVFSRGFNLLVRLLFGLNYTDTQCGGKVFKRNVAKSIFSKLYMTDWSFDVNLLYNAKKGGYIVVEVPVPWQYNEKSKLNISKIVPMMFLSIIRLRLLNSPLKFLIK